MTLEILPMPFSVCQLADLHDAPTDIPFTFLTLTDEEISLVCPTSVVPEAAVQREDSWRAFRIAGVLDFSLIGILASIAGILADEKIPVFCCSTYNTDYILVKDTSFSRTAEVLAQKGYEIQTK